MAVGVAVAVFALGASLLCIIPLAVNVRLRNLSGSAMAVAALLVNFQNFFNAVYWPDPLSLVYHLGTGLCDIEVKIYVAFPIAVVGGMASISRQLASVFDTEQMVMAPSKLRRRINLWIDITFCIILPAFAMVMHVFVSYYRYYLIEVNGCTPSYHESWPTLAVIYPLPLLLCAIAAVYCIMATYRLIKYHKTASTILASSSSMTQTRYARLFGLCVILLLVYCPVAVYTLWYYAVDLMIYPYSWKTAHVENWSTTIPKFKSDDVRLPLAIDRGIQIATGYLFFLFFGLGQEARAIYKACYQFVLDLCKLNLVPRLSSPETMSMKFSSTGIRDNTTTDLYEADSSSVHEMYTTDIYEISSVVEATRITTGSKKSPTGSLMTPGRSETCYELA